jgi:hypothetical protein
MYKVYVQWLYILHIVYIGKGDWTLVSLAHTNVLAIKLPHTIL